MLLPVIVACVLVAALIRRRLLRLWQREPARLAVVVDSRPTALAPLSRAVRCTLRDGHPRQAVTVFIPQSGGNAPDGRTAVVGLLGQGTPRAPSPRSCMNEGGEEGPGPGSLNPEL